MSQAFSNPVHESRSQTPAVQHSKDRALTEREFELLLEGARELAESDYYYDPDPEFVIYMLGRCGLRRGELAHMREDWIDWRDRMIRIPAHDTCDFGEGGSVCGACRQSAEQRAEHNENMSVEEALGWMWAPKTEAGARDIFYGHDVRAEMYLNRYFSSDEYNRVEMSGTAITRRVKQSADLAPELDPDDVHPHGLRATAASFLAGQGIGQYQLMQYFGWVKSSTAENYISRNSMNTARHLQSLSSV